MAGTVWCRHIMLRWRSRGTGEQIVRGILCCGEGVGERFVKAELAEAEENFLRSTLISVRRMYGHFGDFGDGSQLLYWCRYGKNQM